MIELEPPWLDDCSILVGQTDVGTVILHGVRSFQRIQHLQSARKYRVEDVAVGTLPSNDFFGRIPAARIAIAALSTNLGLKPWDIAWKGKTTAVVTIETLSRLLQVRCRRLDAILELDVESSVSLGTTLGVSPAAYISIRPASPQPFAYYQAGWSQVAAFVSLMTGVFTRPNVIELSVDGKFSDERPLSLVVDTNEAPAYAGGALLFHLREASILESVFGLWMELFPQHEIAFGHLVHAWTEGSTMIESRFMAVMQGLEVFHRRSSMKQTFVDETAYEEVREALMRALPPAADKALRDALKTKLGFGNELSQRRRILDLVRSMADPDQLKAIDRKPQQWIERGVKFRNDLVHGTRNLEPSDHAQLHRFVAGLGFLLHYLILQSLKIPPDLVARISLLDRYAAYMPRDVL